MVNAEAGGRLGGMGDWIGVVVALAVGVPLLVLAIGVDVRRRRRRDAELASAPLRGAPEVDAVVPSYISQDDIDAMARPAMPGKSFAADVGGVRLGFGHLDDDFATIGSAARLTGAEVLMVGEDVATMRELLVPLSKASQERPLVIAAVGFHPDVLAALKANRRVQKMPVVAVQANPAELLQLQDEVGGQVLSSGDLKAGWVPPGAWGRAAAWESDLRSITVQGFAGKG